MVSRSYIQLYIYLYIEKKYLSSAISLLPHPTLLLLPVHPNIFIYVFFFFYFLRDTIVCYLYFYTCYLFTGLRGRWRLLMNYCLCSSFFLGWQIISLGGDYAYQRSLLWSFFFFFLIFDFCYYYWCACVAYISPFLFS